LLEYSWADALEDALGAGALRPTEMRTGIFGLERLGDLLRSAAVDVEVYQTTLPSFLRPRSARA
jgi:predicted kinase